MRKVLIAAVALLVTIGGAEACVVDIGTAKTEVYVRDAQTGDVVGALRKGDRVIVTGRDKKGYRVVDISGTKYKVYGDYLDMDTGCADEVQTVKKPGRSRSAEKEKKSCVKGATKKKITGSDFDGVYFW